MRREGGKAGWLEEGDLHAAARRWEITSARNAFIGHWGFEWKGGVGEIETQKDFTANPT